MPTAALLLALAAPTAAAPPGVVVNEIFYHAPDDLDRVQWVELHNPTPQPVAVGGWTLDNGKVLTVPAGTTLPAGGYLVFALDREAFARAYPNQVKPAGTLDRPLKRGGEKLELRDRAGAVVDVVRYKDQAPWPVSADGESASLERICPAAPGDAADNWAASPLPTTGSRPAGTPGRANAAYSPTPPPVVSELTEAASAPPGKPTPVSVAVAGDVREVTLLVRTVAAGRRPGAEAALPMTKGADGRWSAAIPAQPAGTLVRYRVRAVGADGARRLFPAEHDLRPTRSTYVHAPSAPSPLAQAVLFRGPEQPRPDLPRPPRGTSAFVHISPKTGAVELFDHLTALPRTRRPDDGLVLRFHKDRQYREQGAVTLSMEGNERWQLAEALGYDLYRRAGHAAPLTEFVRLAVDGQPARLVLVIERPNKAFLRRNGVESGGNLYKVNWWGGGLEGTHEKKTNAHAGGHDDLRDILTKLEKTQGNPDEQWAVIQKHVDIDQMATMFAVSVAISNWDGYFNNHFVYHDTKSDKWQLYPWDLDQTWGDGMMGDQLLVDMPLMYGAEGVNPGGIGPGWWRPGGVFSKPLLANPHFKKVYLARVRKLLDETFTEKVYHPFIDELLARLGDDAARATGDPNARRHWAGYGGPLKTFVTQRRAFLLAQPELKK